MKVKTYTSPSYKIPKWRTEFGMSKVDTSRGDKPWAVHTYSRIIHGRKGEISVVSDRVWLFTTRDKARIFAAALRDQGIIPLRSGYLLEYHVRKVKDNRAVAIIRPNILDTIINYNKVT